MIHYRFSLLDSKSKVFGISPDVAFDGLYSEDWFQDPWVSRLLEEIEYCKAFGRNMISLVCDDVSFPAENIGQGVKCLITSHFVREFSCNIDHIGENLYRYLEHFIEGFDIHLVGCLNPYHLASLYSTTFPPMYLDDFHCVISRADEFQQYFYNWSKNVQAMPLTYQQLTNWNRKLESPLEINTIERLVSAQRHVFGAKFSLYYKMNFVQAPSSDGKTFLLKRLAVYHELSVGFGRTPAYEIYVLRSMDSFSRRVSTGYFDPNTKYLILVDMDTFSQSISVLDSLIDTPDNLIFLFAGHHMSSYIKVPLPSIYSCKLNRTACLFDVRQSCLVCNSSPDMLDYDTIVTEDSGSGFMLFAPVAKDIRHALPAGGFGGIKSTLMDALRIEDSSRILVVMDYVTSIDIIPQLVELDLMGRVVDIIVPTSSEYCLAFVSDQFDQFMRILQSYHSVHPDRLLEELRVFDKGKITSETLDLLAFCHTFGYRSRKEAKAANVAAAVIKHPEQVPELIRLEKRFISGIVESDKRESSERKVYAEKDHYFGN